MVTQCVSQTKKRKENKQTNIIYFIRENASFIVGIGLCQRTIVLHSIEYLSLPEGTEFDICNDCWLFGRVRWEQMRYAQQTHYSSTTKHTLPLIPSYYSHFCLPYFYTISLFLSFALVRKIEKKWRAWWLLCHGCFSSLSKGGRAIGLFLIPKQSTMIK